MIKINLLTAYSEAAKASGASVETDSAEHRQLIIDVLKRVLVLAIGPGGLIIYEMQTIPVLETKLADTNQKFAELKQFNDSKQNLAAEIKKYEEAQARFNAQMDFINKIDRDKVNEYKLFELLKNSTPEQVWVNKLEVLENIIMINAESTDVKEVEKFIQKMSTSDFITNLSPLNQKEKQGIAGSDTKTVSFQLKAQLSSRGK